MTFTDDLDAVRKRVGIKPVHRVACECGEVCITLRESVAMAVFKHHAHDGHLVKYGTGPARIRIKRLGVELSSDWPWLLKDAERPHGFGHAKTVEAALALAEAILTGQRAVVFGEGEAVIAYRTEPGGGFSRA